MKSILIVLSLFGAAYAQVEGDAHFLFVGSSATDFFNLTKASQFSSVLSTRFYSSTKPTVLYIHGWRGDYWDEVVQVIVEAYLSRGGHNIIAVDWSKYSKLFYTNAVRALPKLSEAIANTLNKMKTLGLNLKKVHIVGYSLGAQLSGMIGSDFKTKKKFSFCRITGLGEIRFKRKNILTL